VPTRRGWAAVAAGLTLWFGARILGSKDLHMVAAGIIALPILAAVVVRWTHVQISVRRHLSAVRVFPGTRVIVNVTVENTGRGTVPFLLLEDTLPAALGRSARLVISGLPTRNAQTVSYSVVCRQRGVYSLGPMKVFVQDPFGLARTAIEAAGTNELIVYPQVEDLLTFGLTAQGVGAGESAVRHLYRSAAEFYTMREYVSGDDLRRIHWPSVARTNRLMIRQDESTRRATAVLFLDNRRATLGNTGSPGFERAVSAAATVGRAMIRAGFALELATAEAPARGVGEERLLDTLAASSPVRKRTTGEALTTLRRTATTDATLAVVCAPPLGGELPTLTRLGGAFGRRIAVLVYPVPPSSLTIQAGAELEGRATAARASLQRAGWDVYLLHPDGKLAEAWRSQRKPERRLRAAASSS
jgi:uncharacterized protein (DUF58 family)